MANERDGDYSFLGGGVHVGKGGLVYRQVLYMHIGHHYQMFSSLSAKPPPPAKKENNKESSSKQEKVKITQVFEFAGEEVR